MPDDATDRFAGPASAPAGAGAERRDGERRDGERREAELDFRGVRRLTGVEEWLWYLLAAATYITLGIWHKWLLNWFVGPVWLIAVIVIGPWLTDRLRITGRTGDRR